METGRWIEFWNSLLIKKKVDFLVPIDGQETKLKNWILILNCMSVDCYNYKTGFHLKNRVLI